MYQRTVLDNGLRIVTSSMPHTRSVCVGIYIGAGSRYESPERAGVSHFVEHLCFKGTDRRPTAKDVCEPLESTGGILNGGTDKELTIYWTKVARPHFQLAVDVLSDMVLHSKLDPQEIEKERHVIIEEINRSVDSYQERADTLIDELLWPGQPMGWDVSGTKETVGSISRQNMVDYISKQYVPNNAVVSAAGDIDHDEVVATLGKALGDWKKGTPAPWFPADNSQDGPRLKIERKKAEQAHLCLAVRGLSSLHPDRFIFDLLNVVLGEGMSSRLFLEVRENKGLAYEIASFQSHFLDTGSLIIYAGVDPENLAPAIETVLHELVRLRDQPVPASEITRARELTKGRLMLSMEDTRSVAGWLGGQELLLGKIRSVDEVVSIIDTIGAGDIQRVASELFDSDRLSLALVGPVRGAGRIQSLLKL